MNAEVLARQREHVGLLLGLLEDEPVSGRGRKGRRRRGREGEEEEEVICRAQRNRSNGGSEDPEAGCVGWGCLPSPQWGG